MRMPGQSVKTTDRAPAHATRFTLLALAVAAFGIGSVVATRLVAPNKRAQAIAMMFTGLIHHQRRLGVPAGATD
ncbi:protein of unknown function [Pseudomonas mediterranea]|jgi:predicted MFS family arabinose efflux permease